MDNEANAANGQQEELRAYDPNEYVLLLLIGEIRQAAGDSEGKLTHSELVSHIAQMKAQNDKFKAALAEISGQLEGAGFCVGGPVAVAIEDGNWNGAPEVLLRADAYLREIAKIADKALSDLPSLEPAVIHHWQEFNNLRPRKNEMQELEGSST